MNRLLATLLFVIAASEPLSNQLTSKIVSLACNVDVGSDSQYD